MFLRSLRDRLRRADELEDQRHAFYEERLSFLAERVKELDDIHKRERAALDEKIAIHDARLKALDFWTRDVGRLAGLGGMATDLETEIETDDPLNTENWDDEMHVGAMAIWPPEPMSEEDAGD